MSCNCNNLPILSDTCATSKTTSACVVCPTTDESLKSGNSEGTTLAGTWLDSTCSVDEIVILGRKGDNLARFSGTGFIKLVDGLASVVKSVPLKVTQLYHNFWKQTPSSTPIPGEPLPFKFQVIADCLGDMHAIQGVPEKNSLTLWDASAKQFVQTPVEEILSALQGEGIIVVKPTATVGDVCNPEESFTSVVEFLPTPTVTSTLKWNSASGYHWSADA